MPQIKLRLPLLVSHLHEDGKVLHAVRPLFFSEPRVAKRRYEEAMEALRTQVREHFKSFRLTQANKNQLLWYCFAPDVKYKLLHLEFQMGKQYVRGNFGVAYFELQRKTFVCLPHFGSFIFLSESRNANVIYQETREVIEKLLRKYRKEENDGDTIDLTPYLSPQKEYVVTEDINARIEDDKFSFEGESLDDMFAALMGGSAAFDGARELEKVGKNLCELPKDRLHRAFYREEWIEKLYYTIFQKENTPLAIVGEAGVGKHTLLHELVRRYKEEMLPKFGGQTEFLTDMWIIDPTRIIAGMSIVGMWQRRFETILQHLRTRLQEVYQTYKKATTERSDKIIIDNPVALLRIGKSAQNSMTLSDVLKPYMEKRLLQVIVLATPEEWKILQERDRRFADLFQVVRLAQPDHETAVRMMIELRKKLELQHSCRITIPALRTLFNLRRNYFRHIALPGAVARHLHQLSVKYSHKRIDVEEVQAEFATYSGLRQEIFDPTTTVEPQEIEDFITASLIGQPDAAQQLANALHLIKAKLCNPNRPLASFLFIGPTGVGKTEAAKVVCQYLLDNPNKLMRFDMNEYIDAGAISRLIGDYYNPEGQLTGRVRYQPFGVLLFDEIEKAHPKVHDLLLQVLDDARLTDSLGRTVDFSNTIIIMTSNIGAQQVSSQLGFEQQTRNDEAIYRKAVENAFRPEFINRIDKIVVFGNLTLQHIFDIARLQIRQLLQRDGFVRRTTILNIQPEALQWVAQRGFDARMGGRALKRQLERDLTTFTAEQLINTSAEQPIILDIQIRDGQLMPRVEPLDFVPPLPNGWLPQIPSEGELKRAFGKLLSEIESLDKYINAQSNGKGAVSSQDWHYYDFTNQIAEKKEKLRRLVMGFRNSYLENIPSSAFRLKNAGTSSIIYTNKNRRGYGLERTLKADRLFQESALQEIQYVYQHAPEQFDKGQTLFLQDCLDLAYLRLVAPAAVQKKTQKARLCARSTVSQTGEQEIDFLLDTYRDLLTHVGIGCKYNKKEQYIDIEGFALKELLQGEEGYHFFYKARQNPLPLRLWLQFNNDSKEEEENTQRKVIRMYDIWLGKTHKSSTITDLRTGFTNQADIRPEEFKLFLLAALPNLGQFFSTQVRTAE